MTIKFQICLYFFFLSIGCQTKTQEGITIPVDNNKLTAQITDLFSTINIIPLETQDSTLKSGISFQIKKIPAYSVKKEGYTRYPNDIQTPGHPCHFLFFTRSPPLPVA